MYSFGSGVLVGTRTDVVGATPVNFGLVQEVTIEETATVKELYGQYQHPIAIARGTMKTTGKAKVARISGGTLAEGSAEQKTVNDSAYGYDSVSLVINLWSICSCFMNTLAHIHPICSML